MDGIEVINSTPTLKWANADTTGCLAQVANSDAHIAQAIGKSYAL